MKRFSALPLLLAFLLFFPFCKDNGICLLGKRSGGGACFVIQNSYADGFVYQNSACLMRLINQACETIDVGVEPDYVLDYSAFFDIESVGRRIEEFYSH